MIMVEIDLHEETHFGQFFCDRMLVERMSYKTNTQEMFAN